MSGAPALDDASTDVLNLPEPPLHTHGLLNPDGILGVVPGSTPLEIIYEQKILNGDKVPPTALSAAEQCKTSWAGYYANNPFGTGVNDDLTYLLTLNVNAQGVPANSGNPGTIPANTPVVGNAQGFFGRVYAPSGASFDEHDITVIFAGYQYAEA